MAQRRMFSKSITNSSQFLMMPQSSQNLYFHLGMNADDDGFCEHFSLMRMTDSKPDDLKILQAKGFVNVFDDKVLIITDWKENNYLRSDRYSPSKYLEVYKEELLRLSSGIPVGIPTVASGKVRLGKDRIGKVINTMQAEPAEDAKNPVNQVIEVFYKLNPAIKWNNKTYRQAITDLLTKFQLEQVLTMANYAVQIQGEQYAPSITTPLQLRDKLGALISYKKKSSNKTLNLDEL